LRHSVAYLYARGKIFRGRNSGHVDRSHEHERLLRVDEELVIKLQNDTDVCVEKVVVVDRLCLEHHSVARRETAQTARSTDH